MLYFLKKNVEKVNHQVLSLIKLELTHWGRVTNICISELTIIGLNNGLLPGQHQAII